MAFFIWVGLKRRKNQFLVMPLFVFVLPFFWFALASSNSDQGEILFLFLTCESIYLFDNLSWLVVYILSCFSCDLCLKIMNVGFVGTYLFKYVMFEKGATLLEIKKSFRDVDNILYDWRDSPSSDYCGWRGVTCDNATFNVVALYVFSFPTLLSCFMYVIMYLFIYYPTSKTCMLL